jgi:hypothetical protein
LILAKETKQTVFPMDLTDIKVRINYKKMQSVYLKWTFSCAVAGTIVNTSHALFCFKPTNNSLSHSYYVHLIDQEIAGKLFINFLDYTQIVTEQTETHTA